MSVDTVGRGAGLFVALGTSTCSCGEANCTEAMWDDGCLRPLLYLVVIVSIRLELYVLKLCIIFVLSSSPVVFHNVLYSVASDIRICIQQLNLREDDLPVKAEATRSYICIRHTRHRGAFPTLRLIVKSGLFAVPNLSKEAIANELLYTHEDRKA